MNGRKWQLAAVAAAALVLALVVAAVQLSGSARADSSASCADSITSAPTGPATVSAMTKAPFGKVLVVGAGPYAGCSLYLLTSDQLHSLIGADYACSDNANLLGAPCDTFLWPALLTEGRPVAGRGVNPTLLGTVTRTDIQGLPAVQQVTYAGQPLYRFFLDESSDEIEGANLFDPVTSPTGIWELVDPSRGRVAAGQALLHSETAPLDGTGTDETVLAATMDEDFSLFTGGSFPVYTLSTDRGHKSACQGVCAQHWPPVLTDKAPRAGAGVDRHGLGIIVRSDGTHQVTYDGKPLYLFAGDAFIPGLPYGDARIDGDGLPTAWGTFSAIPLS